MNREETDDWRTLLKEAMGIPGMESKLKDLKDYTMHLGELYRRLPGGILAKCISTTEGQLRIQQIHSQSCGSVDTVSLYRRLQRAGYYWPEINEVTSRYLSILMSKLSAGYVLQRNLYCGNI